MVSISLLRKFQPFEGLTNSELEKIAPLCREEVYDVGEVIVKEGEETRDFCIVMDGEVALEMALQLWPHALPRQVTIEVVTRGEPFCWSALVEPHISTLSARCRTKARVIAIEGAALRSLFEANPHLGYKLMWRLTELIASRLKKTRAKLLEFFRGEELAQEYTPEEATLIRRVHYFIGFRWASVVALVTITPFAKYILHIGIPLVPIFVIAALVALYNSFFWFKAKELARASVSSIVPKARSSVFLQSIIDLVTFTALVHFTGGVENPFIFLCVFHIIIVSVLLSYKTAYQVATLALFLLCSLVLLECAGVIPHIHLEGFIAQGLCRNRLYLAAILTSLAGTLYTSTYVTTSIAGELRKRQREVASLKDRCLIDVKALEEANKKLMELDRLRTHFLAMASHDLKAPLAAVQSYLYVILGGFAGEITEKQREMLERSRIRIAELLNLINDLLDATRIEAGQIVQEMEEVSLLDVVEDALENVRSSAEEKGLELLTDMPEALPQIKASPRRLVQVLTNLLNNAVQFTPSGGKITLRVRELDEHIQVEVMDTGIGISPEDMPRIFEEFYRGKSVKTKGAGLGLAIAKKIIEAHGGKIWAESPYPESEKGSKFTCTLPKSPQGGKP